MNSASSGAYYAMFHAARAALESRGIDTGGRKHGTITQQFGLTFVKHGPARPGPRPEPQEGAEAAARR